MRKITFLVFLLASFAINSQSLWNKIAAKGNPFSKSELKFRKSTPTDYTIYSLDVEDFKKSLSGVSKRKTNVVLLPVPKGNLGEFSIKEDSNFEGKLNSKYGFIKSFSAQGIDDPTAVAKISVGTDGVYVMIMSGKHSTFYVDPYTKDKGNYIAYERANLTSDVKGFKCSVEETKKVSEIERRNAAAARNADDAMLRDYRLALACTGEYAQFHLNQQGIASGATDAVKKAAVLSAMNTTMTRVNGVYERDLSVKMTIVLNGSGGNDLIFLDPATDNLTNNDANTLINESQAICDNVVGTANYDIGHTFSTGAGGLAGLGVVCANGQKGRGVTGTNSPINDPYDIDFVAHEMGHQFGANHTFNGSDGNCGGGNRNNSTAVEPGSGVTIMAYAGICGAQNIAGNSIDVFHAVSIDEMWAYIQSQGNCRDGVATSTNNAIPTANAGADVNIPKSTPFVLRGVGTDADGKASLTYNWEQIDTEISTQPPLATNTGGPNFRSLPSKASSDRYMPTLPTVIGGNTSTTWEVLPSVAREMNFSLVVRDNNAGGGASARDDIKITVTDANPFTVTSQNTAVTWDTGTSQTVTWDKSTTDVAPINTANVKIKLSTDGGITFPVTLVESTPNDGSYTLTVPNNPTTQARIMVEAVGNIFYNVNTTNFTITSTLPTFVLANNTAQQDACDTGGNTVSYTLNLDFVNEFSENVTFSVANEPTGSTVSFSPTSTSSDGDVIMTVSNFDGATAQLYTMQVTGTSTSVTRNVNALLNLLTDSFASITLSSPANGSVDVSQTPTLEWVNDTNANSYDFELATDSSFSNIIVSENVTGNSYITSGLPQGTEYFWRVKPKNICGEGSFSSVFSFTTLNCAACASSGTTTFDTSITLVNFNTISNSSAKPSGYNDYSAISTTVDKGASYDLTVNVNTDGSVTDHVFVWIDWNQDCDFDDAGEEYDLGTAFNQTDGQTNLSPLSVLVPTDAVVGSTTMRVTIKYNANPTSCENSFDGEVEDYTIEVQNPAASVDDFNFGNFSLYPNPSNGEVNLSFNVIDTDNVNIQLYDLRGRKISENKFNNVSSQFSEKLTFDSVSSGIYLLRISNGGKQSTKKIIIE